MNANTGYKHDTDVNLCVSGPKKKIVSDCMVFKIRVGRSGFFYSLTNEVAKGYSNPSVRHILVNTLGSTSFNGF